MRKFAPIMVAAAFLAVSSPQQATALSAVSVGGTALVTAAEELSPVETVKAHRRAHRRAVKRVYVPAPYAHHYSPFYGPHYTLHYGPYYRLNYAPAPHYYSPFWPFWW